MAATDFSKFDRPLARKFNFVLAITCCCLFLANSPIGAQEFRNSIASTDFDFIHDDDPSTFESIVFVGKRDCEMPDKRPGHNELIRSAFVFLANFSDGTIVELAIDSAFENRTLAEQEANRYVPRLGKLPTSLRRGVRRLVVHKGGEDTTAFSDAGLIVVYSENAAKRISNHDLEETIFHESVHAAWDKKHAETEAWRRAQAQDGKFVTLYAKRNPAGEDLAESALFAYTLTHHPERIPPAAAEKIKKSIPARIRFVAELIPPDKPIFFQVDMHDRANVDDNLEDKATTSCLIDLHKTGQLADIISNVLLLQFDQDEQSVRQFLDEVIDQGSDSASLFQMTLAKFKLEENKFRDSIIDYLHCNCAHAPDDLADKRARQVVGSWKSKPESSPKDNP